MGAIQKPRNYGWASALILRILLRILELKQVVIAVVVADLDGDLEEVGEVGGG